MEKHSFSSHVTLDTQYHITCKTILWNLFAKSLRNAIILQPFAESFLQYCQINVAWNVLLGNVFSRLEDKLINDQGHVRSHAFSLVARYFVYKTTSILANWSVHANWKLSRVVTQYNTCFFTVYIFWYRVCVYNCVCVYWGVQQEWQEYHLIFHKGTNTSIFSFTSKLAVNLFFISLSIPQIFLS